MSELSEYPPHIRSFEILRYVFEPSVAAKHDISLVLMKLRKPFIIIKIPSFFSLLKKKILCLQF